MNNDSDFVNVENIDDNLSVENNSFLLLSSHRNDYFNKYSKKISKQNPDYQGYLLNELFFSQKNIEIIQRQIILNIYKETNNKYTIPFQNSKSIEVVMKYIFNEQAKHLPYGITEQIRNLNKKIVDELTPMIIINIDVKIKYLKDINSPPPVNQLPINVHSAGNKTLSSYTSTFIDN